MLTHPATMAGPSAALFAQRGRPGVILRRAALGLAALLTAGWVAPAGAQQAIVQPGYAVVTGFSGYVAAPAPSGADPQDYLGVNADGPSARVVDLTAVGPQGSLSSVPKPFTVSAQQVGQVFGVAIDNAQEPNFYLAATSAYGLSVAVPDQGGALKRVHTGTAGAQFIPGQFGPSEQGGGPGSVWRVDGVTGAVSLLVNIDGGSGSVASLGGLAFDPGSRQIFVAERGTGVVYRIGLDGTIAGTYDHGAEGRPGAGLPPIAMSAPAPVDIQSPSFDTGNPQTWGVAPPARRVFALAVHNQRLYYSVAQGPQIWSVPIGPSGAISGGGARVEVEVPALADGIEIASIAFDGQGDMYLAERGATTGDYDLAQLAIPGQSRVMRYVPKPAGDPSPGFWRLAPDQYSIGLAPAYTNANGGVALNYGYGQDGRIDFGDCGATLWSTGERLLDPGDGSTGFPTVDGLQGNDTDLVQPQNTPPTASWFVDYDDQPGDPNFRGYMGAVATVPCLGHAAALPPPPPVFCPPGTYFANGQCLIFPSCPAGTTFLNGDCVYPNCPPGFIRDQRRQCVPPPQSCPRDSYFYQGRCVPFCPPGLRRLPNGYCACPLDMFYRDGRCIPPNNCPPRTHYDPRVQACIPECPPRTQYDPRENRCLPLCPPNTHYDPRRNQCVPECPPRTQYDPRENRCVPQCPPNTHYDPRQNQCVPECPPRTQYDPRENRCVPACPPNTHYDPRRNQCVPQCLPGIAALPNGACPPPLPPCPKLTERQPDGSCKPIIIPLPPGRLCLAPKEMVNGRCVDPCPRLTQRQPNGSCRPITIQLPPGELCAAPKEMVNGRCVDHCATRRLPDGSCRPPIIINPGTLKPLNRGIDNPSDNPGNVNPGKFKRLNPVEPKCDPNQHLEHGTCVDNRPKLKPGELKPLGGQLQIQ